MKIHTSTKKINLIFLCIILMACYAYFFPRWADPNQNSRLDMVVAVVDDGTLIIDKYVANTVDFALYNGHYYSDKPPGAAFLGIPFYAGLKWVLNTPFLDKWVVRLSNNKAFQSTLKANGSGVYTDKVRFAIAQIVLTIIAAALPSLLICILLYLILLKFDLSPGLSAVTVLTYGLLTPAFTYANAFYDHQLSTALLVAAFYLVFTMKTASPLRMLLVGSCLAYAIVSEYQAVLLAGLIFVYAFYTVNKHKQWPQIGWVILMGALGAGVIMAYNKAVFGGPFNLGYGYSANWTVQHHTGFMSLTMPHWDAVWGMTFSLFRGVFILSPLLLLAIPGFVAWWRSRIARHEWVLSLACALTMFLFNSSSIMWWGGFSVGPRYFLPALPFMSLAIGFSFKTWAARGWFKLLAGVLSIWSLLATWGMTLAGQSYPPDTILEPFRNYLLVNWQIGNIARNIGTVMGLPGFASLLPLLAVLIISGIAWVWINQPELGQVRGSVKSIPGPSLPKI